MHILVYRGVMDNGKVEKSIGWNIIIIKLVGNFIGNGNILKGTVFTPTIFSLFFVTLKKAITIMHSLLNQYLVHILQNLAVFNWTASIYYTHM